jgi:hypothetical protein
MSLGLVTINKVGPLWYVHASDHRGSLERAETQEKAHVYGFGILAYRWKWSILGLRRARGAAGNLGDQEERVAEAEFASATQVGAHLALLRSQSKDLPAGVLAASAIDSQKDDNEEPNQYRRLKNYWWKVRRVDPNIGQSSSE